MKYLLLLFTLLFVPALSIAQDNRIDKKSGSSSQSEKARPIQFKPLLPPDICAKGKFLMQSYASGNEHLIGQGTFEVKCLKSGYLIEEVAKGHPFYEERGVSIERTFRLYLDRDMLPSRFTIKTKDNKEESTCTWKWKETRWTRYCQDEEPQGIALGRVPVHDYLSLSSLQFIMVHYDIVKGGSQEIAILPSIDACESPFKVERVARDQIKVHKHAASLRFFDRYTVSMGGCYDKYVIWVDTRGRVAVIAQLNGNPQSKDKNSILVSVRQEYAEIVNSLLSVILADNLPTKNSPPELR